MRAFSHVQPKHPQSVWSAGDLLQTNDDGFIEQMKCVKSLITEISGSLGFSSLITELLLLLFTTGAWVGATGGTIDSMRGISSPSPVVMLPC